MTSFRLPRKVKKSLKSNIWVYAPDEKGNSLMASPRRSQKDYTAIKNGTAKPIVDNKHAKAKRVAYKEKMDKEIFVDDQIIKTYVDDILDEEYRLSSYKTLIAAKNNTKAIVAYFNFINAYHFYQNGDVSYGNVCCSAVDYAKELLKKKRKH